MKTGDIVKWNTFFSPYLDSTTGVVVAVDPDFTLVLFDDCKEPITIASHRLEVISEAR